MRLVILCFMMMPFLLISQDGKPNFVNIYANAGDIEWCNEKANTLYSLVDNIFESHRSKSDSQIGNHKRELVKIFYVAPSRVENFNSMIEAMQFDSESITSRFPGGAAEYEEIMSKAEGITKMRFSEPQIKGLNAKAKRLNQINNILRSTEYAIHLNQEEAQENLVYLLEFSQLLKESSDILNKAKLN